MMISRVNPTYDNHRIQQNGNNEKNDLQTKLMAEQRRLKAVDSDTNMNASEKTKEKLRIQQQIDDLSRKMKKEEQEKEQADAKSTIPAEEEKVKTAQTEDDKKNKAEKENSAIGVSKSKEMPETQRQTEAAKEKQKAKDVKEKEEKNADKIQSQKAEEAEEAEKKSKQEKSGISPQELHKILSADSELQKERVLNNVYAQKEGTEDVLRAEIKSDEIQGTDTTDKKEKLARMRSEKPIQIEAVEDEKKAGRQKAEMGMKIVIREDALV